jgi:hypothetical protein
VNAAVDIFGDGNAGFYGGGVSDVFIDGGGTATEAMLERLMNWSSTVLT